MKKLLQLSKVLLILIGLCMGTNAWGDNMTTMTGLLGPTDNSNDFATYKSKAVTLAAGESYVYTFTNHNKGASGTDYWENWVIEATDGTKYLDFRADGGNWGELPSAASYSGSTNTSISSTKTTWLRAYNGVTVTVTVSRSNDGTTFTVAHTATTNAVDAIASQTYAGTYTATIDGSANITFYLTNEDSHQIINKVVYTDASGNTQYSFNASGSAYVDSSNGTTNYNGANVNQLQINNTQYRNWNSGSDGSVKFNSDGKVALYKFDLSEIKNFSNITAIDVSVVGISSDASKSTSPVWLLGYNPEWSASTITYSSGFTNDGNKENLTGTVSGKGSFQPLDDTNTYTINGSNSGYTTMSANAKTYVESAIEADNDYVSFGLAVNLGRTAYLNVGADLTISCSASVVYTATFTETNSLNPTVTIYSDEDRTEPANNGALTDGTTYYYRAVLEGYQDYEGSFTVNGAGPTVEFTMTAKTVYNFSVNAVDGKNEVIKPSIVEGTCYADETKSFYLPDAVLVDGTLYFRTGEDSYKTETVTSNNQIFTYEYTTKTINNVVFFVEGESVSGAATSTASGNQRLASNGYMGRGSNLTITTLPAGAYTIYVHYINTNSGAHTVVVKAGETEVINNSSVTVRPTINGSVYLTEPTAITLTANGSSTSGVDYIYIVQSTNEEITISNNENGLSSYVSTFPLDFTGKDITAYIATGTEKTNNVNFIKLTSVTQVPKNTPIIVKGTAGSTYNVPVCDYSEALEGNLLKGSTTEEHEVLSGEFIYALKVSDGMMHPVTTGVKIPKKKAYLELPAAIAEAKAYSFTFIEDNEETTAITTTSADGKKAATRFFNAAGQQVGAGYKGMVIDENGNKYIK